MISKIRAVRKLCGLPCTIDNFQLSFLTGNTSLAYENAIGLTLFGPRGLNQPPPPRAIR